MKIFSKFAVLVSLMLCLTSASAQIEGDVLTVGDSLTAGLVRSASGRLFCAAQGGTITSQRACIGDGQRNIGGWQPALSSALGVGVFNYGNSGELTSAMLARLSAHMARTPSQYVLILGGTNDAIFRVPQAQTIANLRAMIALVRNAGREPIIGTLPPLLRSDFASRNADILSINAQIRQFEDIQVADHYSVLVGNWAQNTSGDFIHLGAQGNAIVAQEWLRAINVTLEPEPEPETPVVTPAITLLLSGDD